MVRGAALPTVTHSIAAQAVGAALRAIISFALVVFLGRALGTAGFGQYIAILNGAILALILIEAGWPTLLYRDGATHGFDAARLVQMTGFAVATALTVSVTLALVALAVANTGYAAALLCMGLVAICGLVSARLHGAGQFGREALWQIALRVTSALAIVACVVWLTRAPAALFLAWAVGLAAVLPAGARALAWPRRRGLRPALTLTAPFLVYAGLTVFLTKGDMAILGLLSLPATQLSWYAAGSRLTEFALLCFEPVLNVLLRHLRQADGDAPRQMRITRAALAAAAVLGLLAVTGSLAFGPPAMRLLFGPSYTAAGHLLPWIAAILPFGLANLVLCQVLLAQGRERELARLLGAAALVLLGALILGARLDAARGAAIGVVTTYAGTFAVCLWRVLRSSADQAAQPPT